MSRSKGGRFASRPVSDDELLRSFDHGLTTLSHLATVYDNGHYPICLLMAVEVTKLLSENGAAIKLRGRRTFMSIDFGDDTRMLNAMHKLTGARMGGTPPKLDFVPAFYEGLPPGQEKALPFKDWWNKDVIYRASAALPGSPPGMIPVNDTPSVPFEKREHINRRDFVSLLRNKLGAHQESEMPHLLDELEDARSWGGFIIQTPDGVLSTDDGTLAVGATIMAAMMRQIAHEVLLAYGRADAGPPKPA